MARVSIQDVDVDKCSGCGGLWLDVGEIKLLAEKQEAAVAGNAQLAHELDRLAKGRMATEPGLFPPGDRVNTPCPHCGGKLTVVVFGPTKIEQCHKCDGIYLDRGELGKAMELVKSGEAATIMALARSVFTSGEVGP
jgi:Zn-finger nucleic acid-binding protein